MRTPGLVLTICAAALVAVGAAQADDALKLTGRLDAEATFAGAFQGADGQAGDLQLNFLTDANGDISNPTLGVVANGMRIAKVGYCEPVCITYGNPKKTRCFFQSGCGGGPGSPPSTLDVAPVVVEFGGIKAGNTVKMDIAVWRDGATTPQQSIGTLDFSNIGAAQ